jgi:predicted Zn-dependent protease
MALRIAHRMAAAVAGKRHAPAGDRMRRLRRLGVVLLLVAIAASGARAARAQTPARAKPRAGPDATAEVLAELGRVEMPELQGYVSAVGQRLVRQVPQRGGSFHFYVVDQWVPNAFALPDGAIFVSRGLVALAVSEDELANVLAHEITHVMQRHAIGRQAVSQAANPFLLGMARAAYLAGFSRDQERDADHFGQQIAAASGYDPRALSEFLRKLEYAERIEIGASRIPGFFDTHPSTAERAGTAFDRASKLPWKPQPGIARDGADYVKQLEGLPMGDDPAQGIFRDTRFLHPDLGFTVFFPDGWTPVNTAQAVGALSPRGDARIALEIAGEGTDVEAVAREYLAKRLGEVHARIERSGPVSIGGRPGFEAAVTVPTPAGLLAAQLTFLGLGPRVYLFSSVARATAAQSYRGRATATVRSFRALEPEELDGIQVMRLRSAHADEGETLPELSRRTRNALDLQHTAVANGLFTEALLHKGQVLKVAVSEPYRPRKAPPPMPGVAAPAR